MNVREEILHGNLMLAILNLDKHGVPEHDVASLASRYEDRILLDATGYGKPGKVYHSKQAIQEYALELLDTYSPKQKEVPLHERTASLKKGARVFGVQNCYFMLDGNQNNDLPFDSEETVERMVACWNACKGIPTDKISLHPAPLFKLGSILEERRKLIDLIAVIRPLFSQWNRQKSLFPDLEKDGWMDSRLMDVQTFVNNIGCSHLLAK